MEQIKHLADYKWSCGCSIEPPSKNKVFVSFVDDIFRTVSLSYVNKLLVIANRLHPNLQFTIETEDDCAIAFLDMWVSRQDRQI